MDKTFTLFFIFLLSIFLVSCDKFEGEQEIPAYLKVDTIHLIDNPDFSEGSLVHDIQDIWLTVDDQLIGAFELPALIPVLKNGKQEIRIQAGVKFNGMTGTRGSYPFYQPIDIIDFNFVIDSIIEYLPEVKYYSNTVIAYYESFDDGISSLKPVNSSDTSIIVDNNYGIIYLDENHNQVECVTNFNEQIGYVLPTNNSPVFLELEYKCNQIFGIGLYITTQFEVVKEPVIFINPTDKWKKIYINLTPNLNSQKDVIYSNIYILAQKNSSIEQAEIMLDNFKLIYKDI